MSEWTEDEIEAAARAAARANGYDPDYWALETRERHVRIAEAVLSAVPRVPEGYWLALDEPSSAILASMDSAHKVHDEGQLRTIYRAMRDAAKG